MKPLFKLFYLKNKGAIRNIYSKPLSAILTTIGLLFLVFIIVMRLVIPMSIDIDEITNPIYLPLILTGAIMMLYVTLTINKSQALFFVEDSYYLFTQPFTNKQIFQYLLLQGTLQALGMSVYIVFMVVCIFNIGDLFTPLFLAILFLASFITCFTVLLLQDILYLSDIDQVKKGSKGKLVAISLLVLVAGVIVLEWSKVNFDISQLFNQLASSQLIDFIPVFGWLKGLMNSYFQNQPLDLSVYTIAFIILDIVLYYRLVTYNKHYQEQAMVDAETASAMKEKIQKTGTTNEKLYKAKGTFKAGAWALASKNILLLKKTRQLLKKQDILILVIYGAMTFAMGQGYSTFSMMMMFWLFVSVTQLSLGDEFNTPYLYLIPDSPYKKMAAILLPAALPSLTLVICSFVLGGILFQASVLDVLGAFVSAISMVPLFFAGTILSIRLLKSGTNIIAENLLRVLICIVVMIPSVIITIGLFIMFQDLETVVWIAGGVMVALNFIISMGIIMLCAPMLKGRELAD